jgi:hypothetical protein
MRRLLAAAAALVAVCAATPAALAATPAFAKEAPPQVALPAPSGRYSVGAVPFHLVDRSRRDPWLPSRPYRELMATVVYPARHAAGYPLNPQQAPGEAAAFDGFAAELNYGIPRGTVDWAALRTAEHLGAPIVPGRHPVLLYSPGAADPRSWDSTLVQQLASQGYVVVEIDHTWEPSGVQFPDGRVALSVLPQEIAKAQHDGTIDALLRKLVTVRVADMRFVLVSLESLHAGRNPDAEQRPLPTGLAAAIDLSRVAAFGQSAGGFTAAEAMAEDPRIIAGVDMDGTLGYGEDPSTAPLSPAAEHGLGGRPFLLMGSDGPHTDVRTEATWKAFWQHDRGWLADLTLRHSAHGSYTDAEALLPQLASVLPPQTLRDDIGTLPPRQALAAENAYLTAFFDHFLRGRPAPLLNGPSPRYPQIAWIAHRTGTVPPIPPG